MEVVKKLSKSCQKVGRATKFSKSHNIQLRDPTQLAKAIKIFPPTQMRYYAKLVWKEVFLKVKVNEANYVRQGNRKKKSMRIGQKKG